MTQPNPTRKRNWFGVLVTSTATLAFWRVRRMWVMLFVTGLGMVAAVMLVCAVPLYSQVALTAGVRDVLTATPNSATLAIDATVTGMSTDSVSTIKSDIASSVVDAGLQDYMNGSPQFVLQTDGLVLPSGNTMTIRGYSMKEVAKHVKLVRGRLPAVNSTTVEVALTPETAIGFHVDVGSILVVPLEISVGQFPPAQLHNETRNLRLHIVGIYTTDAADEFWHGTDVHLGAIPGSPPVLQGTALVSSDTFLSVLDTLDTYDGAVYSSHLSGLSFYYQLNPSHLSIGQLDDVIAKLNDWQNALDSYFYSADPSGGPDYTHVLTINLSGDTLNSINNQSTLERYRARIGVLQIPNGLVLFQILALVLFFVGMMAELLVERQSETIAILRSRGANKWQIFGSFMTQSIVLGGIALVAGPVLALFAVTFIAQRTLSPQELSALDVLSHNTMNVLYGLRVYILTTVLLAIATMGFSIYRVVGLDVLAIRREAARATTRPLWQRLNLDIVAVVIAITGYFASSYVSGISVLDLRVTTLITSPLALVTPLFLVIAGILLVLRLFPLLLRMGASFATRGRGASAMLALGQISRAPRQSVRMTLLLALASAFTIFTLVFIASQEQRVFDLASYQVGAGFSGPIVYDSSVSIKDQTADFVKGTHGVLSATLGYAANATTAGNTGGYPFEVRGVDADTFAYTASWTQANSTQSLDALMHMLQIHRSDVERSHVLPALVDASMWQQLKLSVGERFTLHPNDASVAQINTITYVALAEVEHIPTIGSTGLLFDYQSGDALYHQVSNSSMPRNYLWVKTSDDPTAVASVRAALNNVQPRITQLADRRAYIKKLSTDPLYLDLLGVLALGAITALILALVGNLLASWLSARTRVTNFAVLRALGTSTEQVAGVLTWEQGITYITALLLGIVFGAMLSVTAIPSLVFSSVPTSGLNSTGTSDSFYALQRIIPVQITVPFTLVVALVLLVSICAIALWIMVRVVTQPALGQMLRLNED